MWDPYDIDGLTQIGDYAYGYRQNQCMLSGAGVFSFDDTAWGNVPEGICKTISTCAVKPYDAEGSSWVSGEYVQIYLGFVNEMGRNYSSTASSPPRSTGTLSSFHASMSGFGSLLAPNEDDGSNFTGITTPAGSGGPFVPFVYLLRPTALAWPGQDVSNDANKTIFLQSEIDLVTLGFTIASISVSEEIFFQAYGWSSR